MSPSEQQVRLLRLGYKKSQGPPLWTTSLLSVHACLNSETLPHSYLLFIIFLPFQFVKLCRIVVCSSSGIFLLLSCLLVCLGVLLRCGKSAFFF